jgi:glycerol-3-phosphate O-acyltransferase
LDLAEILKILYDVYEAKEIEDAFIVPVNITYETLPEDDDQWFSSSKTSECSSLWGYIKKLWNVAWLGLGQVRVDFGQPFGLRVSFINATYLYNFYSSVILFFY